MLKFPCPIEQELDKIRDRMWRKSGRNPKALFQMIREEASKVAREYQLDSRVVKTR
ncbi:hypothetical protein KKD19_06185 [Patescibacteria group bacterium]|nr:hypothetical protein [Patescibacteria group bacterium]MBU4512793.1 hypothetical protein [Patescibacteria group bacterium]